MGRRRALVLGAVLVLSIGAFGVQAMTADAISGAESSSEGPYPGNTLISVQTYKSNDGRLIEVTPGGETVWEFDPPDSRVFDGEQLDNGNVLVSYTIKLPPAECPERYLRYRSDHCIRNCVVELARNGQNGSREVWEYSWYDEKLFGHEVHDADRLPSGETAIVDMGNDRAILVDERGRITWQWNASEHLGAGSEFRKRYGGPANPGKERDWTHANDIDRLQSGDLQLSIRNFDTVITVDRETKAIVEAIGEPGNRSLMYHQHNPYRLERWGMIIVADSENDRIVEIDTSTEEIIWTYGGPDRLQYPRDADRLPNGNTLITDTLNNRLIEINRQGQIVWEYEGVRLPYSADRLSVPEEGGETVPGWRLDGRTNDGGSVVGAVRQAEALAAWVVPVWVALPELLTVLVRLLAALGLVAEGGLTWWRRR